MAGKLEDTGNKNANSGNDPGTLTSLKRNIYSTKFTKYFKKKKKKSKTPQTPLLGPCRILIHTSEGITKYVSQKVPS